VLTYSSVNMGSPKGRESYEAYAKPQLFPVGG
jgi:hypothetical protein